MDRAAWDKANTISEGILSTAKTTSGIIVSNCDIGRESTAEAEAALATLRAAATDWAKQLESKAAAIKAAGEGRDELIKQLSGLRAEIEPLAYGQAVADQLEGLKAAARMLTEAKDWDAKLPTFTQVLRRITEKVKHTHEELVVVDFEARLDAEYQALAERDMAAFGVRLSRRGAEAAVTVLPQIGGKALEGVLSEGEQRLHALALFFAELETCAHSVLVFDDPVSSFDYNYIANYCTRLRDFAVKFPDRQIIVLTHNWEFFVQLQTTINKGGLNGHLGVQVLENCAVVADYSEKPDDLKSGIDAILAEPGEPTNAKKEELAAKMRRLIEAVVNSHVFKNERHQYKQKSQPVTAFQRFTKIVALLPAEATTLGDLYGKLSITAHDDPRAAYVNSDKAMFRTRYSQILAIETAIKGRTPP